MGANI